jgi:hypothetical protein
MWGHIFNFYMDLCYVHTFLQNIVSLPMDLYAREILFQRKVPHVQPSLNIPLSYFVTYVYMYL